MVGVEPHVLRYWEEELQFEINRNSQGKRCYSKGDVERFREVKRWKDKGMQLKAVREMMNTEQEVKTAGEEQSASDVSRERYASGMYEAQYSSDTDRENTVKDKFEKETEPEFELVTVENPSDSMRKFEQLLDGIVGRALEKNNERLVQEICDVILRELEDRLDNRLEEKAREMMEQELMKEMLREGERESAAASQKRGGRLRRRWKKWLEQYF